MRAALQILPQLVWGRGTARSVVEGLSGGGGRPLHHSVYAEWSPSPSKLGEDL